MSPEQQLVSSFMQEAGDPLVIHPSDTKMAEPMAEQAMAYMIKGLFKVHDGDICLFFLVEA